MSTEKLIKYLESHNYERVYIPSMVMSEIRKKGDIMFVIQPTNNFVMIEGIKEYPGLNANLDDIEYNGDEIVLKSQWRNNIRVKL